MEFTSTIFSNYRYLGNEFHDYNLVISPHFNS